MAQDHYAERVEELEESIALLEHQNQLMKRRPKTEQFDNQPVRQHQIHMRQDEVQQTMDCQSSRLVEENASLRQQLQAVQPIIKQLPRCGQCSKTFVDAEALEQHVQRRHDASKLDPTLEVSVPGPQIALRTTGISNSFVKQENQQVRSSAVRQPQSVVQQQVFRKEQVKIAEKVLDDDKLSDRFEIRAKNSPERFASVKKLTNEESSSPARREKVRTGVLRDVNETNEGGAIQQQLNDLKQFVQQFQSKRVEEMHEPTINLSFNSAVGEETEARVMKMMEK